jgi:group II intron reverse transcriptase/maturase
MGKTSSLQPISPTLQGIAKQAAQYPEMIFTTLWHHIDVEWLRVAYVLTRKDGASGVDDVTAAAYAANLEDNLITLHRRLQEGRYEAPPVKRCWLEKDDGTQRPIGIPTLEDKIVQRAVALLIEPIYEHDFAACSYGFRQARSAHDAIRMLREQCLRQEIHWILDADVSGFFDTIDHGHLREFLRRRVKDGNVLRMIGKWLHAGVQEDGQGAYPESGTPQGGVISPLLANVFMHYVLDEWFLTVVKPRLKGRCFLVRYADDFVIGCELEVDARRVMAVLPKRFGRYGLTIHPTKTKLVDFRPPTPQQKVVKEDHSFNFLGFTHYWATSRRGTWVIKRKTMRKRLTRFVKRVWQWCRQARHERIRDQYQALCRKLRGYYQYFGIRCNYKALQRVYAETRRAWRYWLRRRSHKGKVTWEQAVSTIFATYPLPKPRIIHNL